MRGLAGTVPNQKWIMLVWYICVQAARRVAVCRQIIKFVTFSDCIIPRVHLPAACPNRHFCQIVLKLSFAWKTSVNVQQAIASVHLSECFIVYTRRAQILESGGHGRFFFTGTTNIFRCIAIPFLTFKSMYQLTWNISTISSLFTRNFHVYILPRVFLEVLLCVF